MQELTPEKIEELRQKHGEGLRALEGATAWLVFRKPTRGEFERFQDRIAGERATARMAGHELAQACIVDPGPDALRECLDAEPALLMSDVMPLLSAMAGDEREKRTVKL